MIAPFDPTSEARPAGPIVLATLLGLALVANPASARTGIDEPAAPDSETITLFDGESLDGWKPADFYKPGEVSAKDGELILAASAVSGGMTGVTTTRDDLPRTNYELSYQARRLSGRDFFAACTFPIGNEYLTLVNGGWGGTVTGLSSIDGADASENLTNTYLKYADDTWYSFRVRVTDHVVRCWIDDEELISFDHRGHHLETRLETRANHPLGFATWQTGGALKDITLRPLSPDEIAEDAEKAGNDPR